MSDARVDLSDVQARLAAEAERLDRLQGGTHRFNNVRRFQNPNGANWTANYGVRCGTGVKDPATLDEMRKMLERVQAEMPDVRFED